MDNTKATNEIENSYILREYFKGFKLSNNDLYKIRDKFNKVDRSFILDCVTKQNSEIYNIIAENYSTTINKFDQISEQINQLNEQLTNIYNDNLVLFSLKSCEDQNNASNNSNTNISNNNISNSLSSSSDNDLKEPTSIKQLNSNINENLNKIQQFQNEIQAKNNAIDNKLTQVKDDENFLLEVDQEKDIYIENLTDEILTDLVAEDGTGFIHPYLYKLMLILFDYVYLNPLSKDTQIHDIENEKVRSKIYKEYKKEIFSRKIESLKKKLKASQTNEIFNSQSETWTINPSADTINKQTTPEKLREINQILENLKNEAENLGKNKIYEKFFFPIFKTLKLVVFISLGKIRVNKLREAVENVS